MKRIIISVQFKDKNKVFKGKSYDYLLNQEEEKPAGDIVRLLDDDYNYILHGTRVKITNICEKDVKEDNYVSVRCLVSSLDED